jgi:putative spermidine/putrescine transport system substrate-binding protein
MQQANEQRSPQRLTRRELLTRATQAGLGLAAVTSLAPLAACAPVAAPEKPAASGPASGAPAAGDKPSAPAVVKGQTLTLALWAGPFVQGLREHLIPEFEKDHGVRVVIEEGISADAIAKVRAARGNPQHTVIGVDDQFIPELKAEGLIVQLTPQEVPNLKEVYPEYIVEDGHGIGVAVSWNSLHYNSDRVKKPITSWAALWDPDFKGRVVIQSFKAGTGIQVAAVIAGLATGKSAKEAQYEIEASFPIFKEKIKPNIHSIVDSTIQALPLVASGEAWLVPTPSRLGAPYTVRGAPVKRAELQEGAPMLLNTVALVKNAPLQDVGRDFINRFVSAKVQLGMAKVALTGPVNKTVQVPTELRGLVPAGLEDASKMIRLDWNHLNKVRPKLVDWWNKEMAS